jgi:hypothetical protein
MANPYYKKCPECRGHGAIDHVNLTRPGPSLWTTPCKACKRLHVVSATDEELAKPTPGPATEAMLKWVKTWKRWLESQIFPDTPESIFQAFIDEWK